MCWVHRTRRTVFGASYCGATGLKRTVLARHSRQAWRWMQHDPSTATHRPYVHRESSKSVGPWTWSINHRSATTEKRVWRRGENPVASWDQNKMFSIYFVHMLTRPCLTALKKDQACLLSWCSNTWKGEETSNLLRTRDHFLNLLTLKQTD